jgi:hypothetical protein
VPIHDWTRVDAGLLHAFHQSWIVKLCDALNRGLLPPDYFTLPERSISGPIPEVATFGPSLDEADVAVAEAALYVKMADRVAVRDKLRQIVAAIETVSPGNKASHVELRAFVESVSAFVETISLGGKLPDMPLFLKGDSYVLAPLEASYQTAWADFPAPMKRLLYSPGAGTADLA